MLNTTAPKLEQARIIGQIQSIYSNADALLKPTLNQVDFEKAVKEDKIPFFFDHVVKSYASKTLESVEQEKDEVKKAELLNLAKSELGCLSPVEVVFDKLVKSIYVDVIDLESNTFKDNAINRMFNRVGQIVDQK